MAVVGSVWRLRPGERGFRDRPSGIRNIRTFRGKAGKHNCMVWGDVEPGSGGICRVYLDLNEQVDLESH